MRNRKQTPENVKFIEDNFFRMTDAEMAHTLNMSISLVRKIRQSRNLSKKNLHQMIAPEDYDHSKGIQMIETGDRSNLGAFINNYTENNREIATLFNRMFNNTQHFRILEDTYSKDEVGYYLQEFNALYSEVKSQGGTLTSSEFRNIDQYIQLTLRRNRLTKEERVVLNDIDLIKEGRAINRLTDEDRAAIFQLTAQIKDAGRNLKEINEQLIKIQESLDMSRKERLKRIADNQSGIPKLIQDIQDEKRRSKIDRHAFLMKKAKQKMEKRWREEAIIMDTDNILKKESAND